MALPGATTAAGTARRSVAEYCHEWDLSALCEDLMLTVSEVVTNAVLHTDGTALLTISLAGDFLRGRRAR